MSQYVKAVVCDNCGDVHNKAPKPWRAPVSPEGPCESCGSKTYVMKVVEK